MVGFSIILIPLNNIRYTYYQATCYNIRFYLSAFPYRILCPGLDICELHKDGVILRVDVNLTDSDGLSVKRKADFPTGVISELGL